MSKLSTEIKQGLKEAIADTKKHNLKRDLLYSNGNKVILPKSDYSKDK